MSSTRLFVLGMLARSGEMHGHQIRRAAQIDRTELWADVRPGSLYGALHRMEAEGVVAAVRTEQVGNRPARTVYAITDEGRAELASHRDEALREVRLLPDPVDLALQFTTDLDPETLAALIAERHRELAAQLAFWRRLREEVDPYLTEMEKLTFRHTLLRLETEVAWHDELLGQLPGSSTESVNATEATP